MSVTSSSASEDLGPALRDRSKALQRVSVLEGQVLRKVGVELLIGAVGVFVVDVVVGFLVRC